MEDNKGGKMSKKKELQTLFNMMGKDDIEELVFELIDSKKIKIENLFFLISEKDYYGN